MYSIHAKKINNQRNAPPITEPKEPAGRDNNHRMNIDGKIDKSITRHILSIPYSHLLRMLAKTYMHATWNTIIKMGII